MVKHTLEVPAPLWMALQSRARRYGSSASSALRKAIWQWTDLLDRVDPVEEIQPREGQPAVVKRTVCVETQFADGTVELERLVYGPY